MKTDGSRDWSDAATIQGMPGAARRWKRQGMRSLLEPLRVLTPRHQPSDMVADSGLQSCERAHLCCFKLPSLWSFATAVICYQRLSLRERKEIKKKGVRETKGKLERRTEGSMALYSPCPLIEKKWNGVTLGTRTRADSEGKSPPAVGGR